MVLRQNKERKTEIVIEGVVAEYGGSYWGCQYEDGQSQEMNYGPLCNATISNPRFCKTPTDMARGHQIIDFNRLKLARLMKVKKATTIEVVDE
ncbi:MAG: hypothetical protein R3230_00230 [Nitrosopumilaceae archaeon]|nr:hypothetical protein [Nitrosopumilaceae archaeon]